MNKITLKQLYYLLTIIYHCIIFGTNYGNYFHDGTVLELIILDIMAVIIVVMCIKLFHKTKIVEKFAIVVVALIPAIAVGMGLFLGAKRVFTG